MNHLSKSGTYILAASSVGLAYLMVRYPETAVSASLQGLQIWWNKVFPALFPFFVLSELMIGFGVVTFFGILFEPIMRPVFRVPGVGGFVFMMGLISGFPAGARMTARLYEEKRLTKTEAERLSSFTNFSNPLFLFSVTALSFFHQPALGPVFALSHYAGNIGVGLVMRFYKSGKSNPYRERHTHLVFTRALQSMHEERIRHYKPFGRMLGDSIISSVTTLLTIGGFIALFSMLTQLLAEINLTDYLSSAFSLLLSGIGFSSDLGPKIVPGIFELTIGAHEIGEAQAPMIQKVILVCGLLGFCGFSIQAQAVSILAQANLSTKPFLIGRLFHAFFSGVAALIIYQAFHVDQKIQADPSFAFIEGPDAMTNPFFSDGPLITTGILILFIFILLGRTLTEARSTYKK
ncbi:sporulation integral membrane protein YlbJ [Sporolactobacillus sp. THM7-4]|nr:sporulation integral membrane protein YlbJ [Sporolactobacillus sp. THM7-4]